MALKRQRRNSATADIERVGAARSAVVRLTPFKVIQYVLVLLINWYQSKVADAIWEELPQEHVNKAVVNFTKRLTAYIMAVAAIFCISSTTNWLCSDPPTAVIVIIISHEFHGDTSLEQYFRPQTLRHRQTTGEESARIIECLEVGEGFVLVEIA